MKTLTTIIISLVLVSSALANPGWEFIEQTYLTSDNLYLHAWLGIPMQKGEVITAKRPLIILLPMMGQTHESYNKFIEALSTYIKADSTTKKQPLPYVLSFDLRGHGQSTKFGDQDISYRSMSSKDFARMPKDVVEMTRHILSDSSLAIDTTNIIVIGASIGANTAIMVTPFLTGVTKVVMLSPGIDYRSLRPIKALKSFAGESLIFVSSKDTYAASSSQKLSLLNKRCTLQIFEGKDHGTNIINNDKQAMEKLLKWLYKK